MPLAHSGVSVAAPASATPTVFLRGNPRRPDRTLISVKRSLLRRLRRHDLNEDAGMSRREGAHEGGRRKRQRSGVTGALRTAAGASPGFCLPSDGQSSMTAAAMTANERSSPAEEAEPAPMESITGQRSAGMRPKVPGSPRRHSHESRAHLRQSCANPAARQFGRGPERSHGLDRAARRPGHAGDRDARRQRHGSHTVGCRRRHPSHSSHSRRPSRSQQSTRRRTNTTQDRSSRRRTSSIHRHWW